jgi:hypothetical protein
MRVILHAQDEIERLFACDENAQWNEPCFFGTDINS